MNCETVQMDLSAFVDGEVESWDALALTDHVLACPSCASFYRGARRLDGALLRDAGEPPSLQPAARRRGIGLAMRRALPLAAMVLLALGAFLLGRAPKTRPTDGDPRPAADRLADRPMTDARFVDMTRDLLAAAPRYRDEMLRVMLATSSRRPLEAVVDRRPVRAAELGGAERLPGNPGS